MVSIETVNYHIEMKALGVSPNEIMSLRDRGLSYEDIIYMYKNENITVGSAAAPACPTDSGPLRPGWRSRPSRRRQSRRS